MLSILKNDWNRLMQQKMHLFVSIMLMVVSVVMSIIMTTKVQPGMNLAVIGYQGTFPEVEHMNIDYLDETPGRSQLVQGQYDAAITFSEDGSYQIDTVKSDKFKNELKQALSGTPDLSDMNTDTRKIGTNIVGFMLMFLMMQGILYSRMFAEDKEKHMIERIVCSPIAFRNYLCGHGLFIFGMIFVPAYIVVVITGLCGYEVGFSYLEYAWILGGISVFATGFALCMTSMFQVADTVNMISNTIIVLSSILAGSFCKIENSSLLGKILYLLPQKDMMEILDHVEKNSCNWNQLLMVIYVIILVIGFFYFGIRKTRKDYVYRT